MIGLMKCGIKKVGRLLFVPLAFILWTIDYYFIYFGLSLFFYGLTGGNNAIKIILVLLVIPVAFFVIKVFFSTTFLVAHYASNKVVYFLLAALYSLNRVISGFHYCSIKSPTIPNSIILELPCFVNLLIVFAQIILIFGAGYVFLVIAGEGKTNDKQREAGEIIAEPSIPDNLPNVIKQELVGKSGVRQSSLFSDVEPTTPSDENDGVVEILGEKIDPEASPILYRKAKEHPESLKKLVLSLARQPGGSVLNALQCLESDLQHG